MRIAQVTMSGRSGPCFCRNDPCEVLKPNRYLSAVESTAGQIVWRNGGHERVENGQKMGRIRSSGLDRPFWTTGVVTSERGYYCRCYYCLAVALGAQRARMCRILWTSCVFFLLGEARAIPKSDGSVDWEQDRGRQSRYDEM